MQPQNNQLSPIWSIDLFERRQFRNGHSEAQCLECGQSFETSDLAAMTAHIVHKHSEYAAKLLAKQLEFGNNTAAAKAEECSISSAQTSSDKSAADGRTMSDKMPCPGANSSSSLDPATGADESSDLNCNSFWHMRNERNTATPFSTIMPSVSPSVSISNLGESEDTPMDDLLDHQESHRRVPSPATPPISSTPPNGTQMPFVADFERFGVPSPATPPLASSSMLSTAVAEDSSNCSTVFPTTQTTTPNANQMRKKGAIYVDRFGKEWHLLVAAVATNGQQQLDQIAGKHFLRRKGPPKYDGRIYFNCRLSDQRQKCAFRGLFLPTRQALFSRRTHNHPTTTTTSQSSTSDRTPTISTQKPMMARLKGKQNDGPGGILHTAHTTHSNQSRCSNEDIVTAFSAALPNIDNSNNESFDRKDHIEKIVNSANSTQNANHAPFYDLFGRQWHWLFDLDDINAHKEQIQQFCHTHFLYKSHMHQQRRAFMCKFSRRNSAHGIVRCLYRAMYVPERRAMFAFQAHNHPMPEEAGNDTAANEASGCFTKCQQLHQQPQQQAFVSLKIYAASGPLAKSNGVLNDSKENAPPAAAVASPPAANSQMGKSVAQFDSTDDYFDNNGKPWKFLIKIDLGGCETFAERTLLRKFCREHGLNRQAMKRYADGTLRAYSLACKEMNTAFKCPYRAVYVVDRRAVFDRNMHNHSTPVGKRESSGKKRTSTTSACVPNPIKSSFPSHPTLDHFLLANLSEHFSPQTKPQQKMASTKATSASSSSSAVDIEAGGGGCSAVSSAAVATVSLNPTKTGYGGNYGSDGDNNDDYVDFVGKRWKFMTTIDAGKCETYERRKHLHRFCRELGLIRFNIGRNVDGTLRVYRMVCKELRHNIQCPFRAVYVSKRGAIFVRGVHDHSTLMEKKQRPAKKAMETNWTKRNAAMAKVAMAKAIATSTAAKNPFVMEEKIDGIFLDISVLSLPDQNPPPLAVVDQLGRLWHWLADVSEIEDASLRRYLLHKYDVIKMCEIKNGIRVNYWCRYRMAPIYCPFKLIHVPGKKMLYHRMHHNHPMPLTTELLIRYRQKLRQNNQRRIMLNSSTKSDHGTTNGKNKEENQRQKISNCSRTDETADQLGRPISANLSSLAQEEKFDENRKSKC